MASPSHQSIKKLVQNKQTNKKLVHSGHLISDCYTKVNKERDVGKGFKGKVLIENQVFHLEPHWMHLWDIFSPIHIHFLCVVSHGGVMQMPL